MRPFVLVRSSSTGAVPRPRPHTSVVYCSSTPPHARPRPALLEPGAPLRRTRCTRPLRCACYAWACPVAAEATARTTSAPLAGARAFPLSPALRALLPHPQLAGQHEQVPAPSSCYSLSPSLLHLFSLLCVSHGQEEAAPWPAPTPTSPTATGNGEGAPGSAHPVGASLKRAINPRPPRPASSIWHTQHLCLCFQFGQIRAMVWFISL